MQTDIDRAQSRYLAKMEHQRSYASNQAAIAALELVTAMSTVMMRRFGQDFADEVRAVLRARAETLQADDVSGQCTATIIEELSGWPIWQASH